MDIRSRSFLEPETLQLPLLPRDSPTACRKCQFQPSAIWIRSNGPLRQPKNAAKDKAKRQDKPKTNGAATAATNGAAKGKVQNPRNKKSGRAGRPKKKTAEELDAEMTDYFGGSAAANGTAQPATAAGGDTGMVDEVL